MSEIVGVTDKWAEVDALIEERFGENGRSFGPRRVIMPRREYDDLLRRALRGDELVQYLREIAEIVKR
jgi:hypothetical protein